MLSRGSIEMQQDRSYVDDGMKSDVPKSSLVLRKSRVVAPCGIRKSGDETFCHVIKTTIT